MYAVNTRGSFLMTKYSLLEMKKRNYGRILLIASIAGKEVGTVYIERSVPSIDFDNSDYFQNQILFLVIFAVN